MAAWPAEVIEERAADIAEAADVLLRYQARLAAPSRRDDHRAHHEQMRRHVSIDFTVPEEQREGLRISAEEFIVPLALLVQAPAAALRPAQRGAARDPAADRRSAPDDRARAALPAARRRAAGRRLAAAGELIEAVLGDEPQELEADIAALEAATGSTLSTSGERGVLSRSFILWAVVRGIDRRRVFKFAYDEPLGRGPGFLCGFGASGSTEALSYHLEVAVPDELKARSTRLVDGATGRQLAAGKRDADRPAIVFRAEAPVPWAPVILIHFAAERWRFLIPAALVATIIALLVAPPFLFADLQALPDTAGAAVGLVLSTSAVFSVLVLRTDEHPLLRLMLLKARALLAASTVAALFAAASIGFRTAGWIIEGTWALAALVSVLTAGILIVEALRAPP